MYTVGFGAPYLAIINGGIPTSITASLLSAQRTMSLRLATFMARCYIELTYQGFCDLIHLSLDELCTNWQATRMLLQIASFLRELTTIPYLPIGYKHSIIEAGNCALYSCLYSHFVEFNATGFFLLSPLEGCAALLFEQKLGEKNTLCKMQHTNKLAEKECNDEKGHTLLMKKSQDTIWDKMLLPGQKRSLGLEVTPLLGKHDILYLESLLSCRVKQKYPHYNVRQLMHLRNYSGYVLDSITTKNTKQHFPTPLVKQLSQSCN